MKNSILCIIPLYNVTSQNYWQDLSKCVFDVYSKLPDVKFLLIDNKSQDNTALIVREWAKEIDNVYFVANSINTGSAGAFKQGVEYANIYNFNFAYLIDQDTIFGANSIERLLDLNNKLKGDYSILCSAVHSTEDRNKYLANFRVFFNEKYSFFYPCTEEYFKDEFVKIHAGGNTGLFLNLNAIGGLNFDETFFYHLEDYEFCLRARKVKPIYLAINSVIYHPDKYPLSTSKLKDFIFNYFVVVLVRKGNFISYKDKNIIKVYLRNSNNTFLKFKSISSCLVAFFSPKHSLINTYNVLFKKSF